MPKMLVSDYDDTIKSAYAHITYLNFQAIKKFRKNGNKFVVATGRDFSSIKRQLNIYNCSYDALICNDGSIGFDDKDRILFSNPLNEKDITQLLYYFDDMHKEYVKKIHFYNQYGYTKDLYELLEFIVIPKPFKNVRPIIKEINEFFPYLTCYCFNNFICIRKKGSKSNGIKEINKYLNVKEEEIYTVGDWKNDYEMIRDYNGYNMIISHPSLYTVSQGTTTSVARLIKKIETK